MVATERRSNLLTSTCCKMVDMRAKRAVSHSCKILKALTIRAMSRGSSTQGSSVMAAPDNHSSTCGLEGPPTSAYDAAIMPMCCGDTWVLAQASSAVSMCLMSAAALASLPKAAAAVTIREMSADVKRVASCCSKTPDSLRKSATSRSFAVANASRITAVVLGVNAASGIDCTERESLRNDTSSCTGAMESAANIAATSSAEASASWSCCSTAPVKRVRLGSLKLVSRKLSITTASEPRVKRSGGISCRRLLSCRSKSLSRWPDGDKALTSIVTVSGVHVCASLTRSIPPCTMRFATKSSRVSYPLRFWITWSTVAISINPSVAMPLCTTSAKHLT